MSTHAVQQGQPVQAWMLRIWARHAVHMQVAAHVMVPHMYAQHVECTLHTARIHQLPCIGRPYRKCTAPRLPAPHLRPVPASPAVLHGLLFALLLVGTDALGGFEAPAWAEAAAGGLLGNGRVAEVGSFELGRALHADQTLLALVCLTACCMAARWYWA